MTQIQNPSSSIYGRCASLIMHWLHISALWVLTNNQNGKTHQIYAITSYTRETEMSLANHSQSWALTDAGTFWLCPGIQIMRHSLLSPFCFILSVVYNDFTSLAHFIIFCLACPWERASLWLKSTYSWPSLASEMLACLSIISQTEMF